MIILGVHDDGITEVRIHGKEDMLLVSAAIKEVLANIPEVMTTVLTMLATKDENLDYEKFEGKDMTLEKARGLVKGREKAKEEDIPSFVQRAIKGEE